MYEIPFIDWKKMTDYLNPLLLNFKECKGVEFKDTSAMLHFNSCKLLLHYDAQDKFISVYILDLTGIYDLDHMIQLTPTFDYFLNGDFIKYQETLNRCEYKYYYAEDQYIGFDYLISILNSKGLENYLKNGLKIDEYYHWLEVNAQAVNQELITIYTNNCLK